MTDWEKVESNVWRPENKEDSIEGVLIAKEKSIDYDTQVYTIEVKVKENIVRRTVYGTTVLDDRMKDIPVGKIIKIVYKGEKQVKRGLTKLFEVFVAK